MNNQNKLKKLNTDVFSFFSLSDKKHFLFIIYFSLPAAQNFLKLYLKGKIDIYSARSL